MRIGPIGPWHQQQSSDGLSPIKPPSDPALHTSFRNRSYHQQGSIRIGVKQTMTPSLIAWTDNEHSQAIRRLRPRLKIFFALSAWPKEPPKISARLPWPDRNLLGFQLPHLVLSLPIQRPRVETAGLVPKRCVSRAGGRRAHRRARRRHRAPRANKFQL
jgi:hypothetical protein